MEPAQEGSQQPKKRPEDKRFMLDIETVGTDPKTGEILQIALLELNRNSDGLYDAGRDLMILLPSLATPSQWALDNHQGPLYESCNLLYRSLMGQGAEAYKRYIEHVRNMIRLFWATCGAENPWEVFLCGRNLRGFDLAWLYAHNHLAEEDHHYRLYELTGALQVVIDATGLGKEGEEVVRRHGTLNKTCEGTPHMALYDCFDQALLLNGCITIARRGVDRGILGKALEDLRRGA